MSNNGEKDFFYSGTAVGSESYHGIAKTSFILKNQ